MVRVKILWLALLAVGGAAPAARAASYPLSGPYPLKKMPARGAVQDSHGRIWLITPQGIWHSVLSEFVAETQSGPGAGFTGCVLEHGGVLWLGSDDGIVGIELNSLTFRGGPEELRGTLVHDLLRDRSGRIWCATEEGLFSLELTEGICRARPVAGAASEPHYRLAECSAGRIWAGSCGAVLSYQSPESGWGESVAVGAGQARALLCRPDGTVWVGMREPGGLLVLPVGATDAREIESRLNDREINALVQNPGGEVWIGTRRGLYGWSDGLLITLNRATGLEGEDVHGVYVDREDLVWISTDEEGVFLLRSPYVRTYDVYDGLPHSQIQALHVISDRDILVGSSGGFCRLNADGRVTDRFDHSGNVTALYADTHGRCWVGGAEGLACYPFASGPPEPLLVPAGLRNVSAIGPGPQGDVLVSAARALWRVREGRAEAVDLPLSAESTKPAVHGLFADSEGGFYLAVDVGLMHWVGERGWTPFPIEIRRLVRSVARDADGRLAVGTEQGFMTQDRDAFRDVSGRGSPYGEIRDIAVDHSNRWWLATLDGLVRYDGSRCVTFTTGDGLPSNDVRCVKTLRPGVLLVGTAEGLAFVESDRLAPSTAAPGVTITDFQAGGGRQPLGAGRLSLEHEERNVSIGYQALGFRLEGKGLRFKSWLEGYDEGWSRPSEQPNRDYTNLPWGPYRFQVKAVSAHGVESPTAASIAFSVEPPFYLKPWFLAAAGAMALGLGALAAVSQRKRRQLQRAVTAANEAKSQFLANVSHEIRTPITVILGCTEMMADGAGGRLPVRECVDTIRRNSNHLLGMINDLLDLSKIEAGRLEVEMVPTSVHDMLSDVDALIRISAQSRGLEMRIVYESDVPEKILTDPTRLRQTLINLMGNAIKFTSRGHVWLRVRAEERHGNRWLLFEVEDTGVGIPADKIGTIFDAFTQAEAATTRKYGGTGLGLAIAKSLAQHLHGDLTVRSELGKGSTFTLAIDLRKAGVEQTGQSTRWVAVDDHTRFTLAPPKAAPRREEDAPPPSLQGHVLVAEDAPDIRGIMCALLESAGARVSTADNGPEAVEQAYDGAFDAILMDIHMPGMDGIAVVREIRERGVTTPVIVVSADSSEERRSECRAAGVAGFLPKPFHRKGFLTEMARHLNRKPSSAVNSADGPIYCELDIRSPRMAAAVAEFARALKERVDAMCSAARKEDTEALAHLAHQLRGAGGIHGYMCVTESARRVEEALAKNDRGGLEARIQELNQLERRIRAGLDAQVAAPAS